jgi:beta-lactamase class C
MRGTKHSCAVSQDRFDRAVMTMPGGGIDYNAIDGLPDLKRLFYLLAMPSQEPQISQLGTMGRARQRRSVMALLAATGLAATAWIITLQPLRRGPELAAAPLETARTIHVPLPPKVDYQQLNARIMLLMQDPDMVGLAVGAVEHGQVSFTRGYGEALAKSGAPVTADTVFRWASLSKGVASALVAGLAEDGRLSLDARLGSMRTTLTLPGDARRVTITDVLSHRVGLVRNAWDDRLEAGEDPKTLRAALGTLPAACPPGTCYGYQNIAYDTATEIVESVTGKDYASAAKTRLFGPLGMTQTSIGRYGLQNAHTWAQPHHRNRLPTSVNDNYYRVPAAGGVNSSIRDLQRWMQAQMGEAPAILSPEMLGIMHRPRVSTPPKGRRGPMDRALTGAAYGLGWRSFVYAGHRLIGHRGSVDGYGSLIMFDPMLKSGIVMLWNSNNPKAARLQLEFFDLLYGLPPTDWLELPLSTVARSDRSTPPLAAPNERMVKAGK